MTRDLLGSLADRILSTGARRVAVDGVDGAGKTVFGSALAAALMSRGADVALISADDFHRPSAVRYRRGRQSPEGYWLDSHDYDALRTDVLDAFALAGSRRYRPAAQAPTLTPSTAPCAGTSKANASISGNARRANVPRSSSTTPTRRIRMSLRGGWLGDHRGIAACH